MRRHSLRQVIAAIHALDRLVTYRTATGFEVPRVRGAWRVICVRCDHNRIYHRSTSQRGAWWASCRARTGQGSLTVSCGCRDFLPGWAVLLGFWDRSVPRPRATSLRRLGGILAVAATLALAAACGPDCRPLPVLAVKLQLDGGSSFADGGVLDCDGVVR